MMQSIRVVACVLASTLALPLAAQPPQRVPLPDGEGKALVESLCVACHETNLIAGSVGYDAAGWKYLFGHMIALPADTADTVSRYLAAHFPATGARAPKLVPGETRVEFEEWVVSILDDDSLSEEERDALWEIRLLLIEAGEGLRPIEDARERAGQLLSAAR